MEFNGCWREKTVEFLRFKSDALIAGKFQFIHLPVNGEKKDIFCYFFLLNAVRETKGAWGLFLENTSWPTLKKNSLNRLLSWEERQILPGRKGEKKKTRLICIEQTRDRAKDTVNFFTSLVCIFFSFFFFAVKRVEKKRPPAVFLAHIKREKMVTSAIGDPLYFYEEAISYSLYLGNGYFTVPSVGDWTKNNITHLQTCGQKTGQHSLLYFNCHCLREMSGTVGEFSYNISFSGGWFPTSLWPLVPIPSFFGVTGDDI